MNRNDATVSDPRRQVRHHRRHQSSSSSTSASSSFERRERFLVTLRYKAHRSSGNNDSGNNHHDRTSGDTDPILSHQAELDPANTVQQVKTLVAATFGVEDVHSISLFSPTRRSFPNSHGNGASKGQVLLKGSKEKVGKYLLPQDVVTVRVFQIRFIGSVFNDNNNNNNNGTVIDFDPNKTVRELKERVQQLIVVSLQGEDTGTTTPPPVSNIQLVHQDRELAKDSDRVGKYMANDDDEDENDDNIINNNNSNGNVVRVNIIPASLTPSSAAAGSNINKKKVTRFNKITRGVLRGRQSSQGGGTSSGSAGGAGGGTGESDSWCSHSSNHSSSAIRITAQQQQQSSSSPFHHQRNDSMTSDITNVSSVIPTSSDARNRSDSIHTQEPPEPPRIMPPRLEPPLDNDDGGNGVQNHCEERTRNTKVKQQRQSQHSQQQSQNVTMQGTEESTEAALSSSLSSGLHNTRAPSVDGGGGAQTDTQSTPTSAQPSSNPARRAMEKHLEPPHPATRQDHASKRSPPIPTSPSSTNPAKRAMEKYTPPPTDPTPPPSPPPPPPPRRQQQQQQPPGIPRHFLCNIMQTELMVDPVQADDGYTYERENIEKHFAVKIAEQQASNNSQDDSQASSSNIDDFNAVPFIKSPMTNRPLRSLQLTPNLSIDSMIVEAIDNERLPLTAEELAHWKEKRKEKQRRDRQREAQELEAAGIPQDVSVTPHYPTSVLSRLVRLDRPDDKFGPNDSGLSVALSHSDPWPAGMYCAVTGCVTKLTTSMTRNCQRCQRAVCEDCNKVQVSEIGREKAVYPICIECVWQITDVLATMDEVDRRRARMTYEQAMDVRETLLREKVATRWEAIEQKTLECERDRLYQQAISVTECEKLAQEINTMKSSMVHVDTLLSKTKANFENSFEYSRRRYASAPVFAHHLESLNKHFMAILSRCREDTIDESSLVSFQENSHDEVVDVCCALKMHDDMILPMNLYYPTQSMERMIQDIQRRLERFVQEQGTLLQIKARQEEISLTTIRKEMELRMSLKSKQEEQIRHLLQLLDGLQKTFEEIEKRPLSAERSAAMIADLLCRHDPPVEAHNPVGDRSTFYLRMCPCCGGGPFEHPPRTGCPRCNCTSEDWPLWDGRGWFD